MIRIFFFLLIISSCSLGTLTKGGEKSYLYNSKDIYSSEKLRVLSADVIQTSDRDPPFGKLVDLFGSHQLPLKRVGIVIFESNIQPTRGGLSGRNLIYLSEAGKQILTENFLHIWEESFSVLSPEVDIYPVSKVKNHPSFRKYGKIQKNYINSSRSTIAPGDIFYVESGKETTSTTLLNPRDTQDMSFLLAPSYDLMGGPKWSEHQKHFLNDVAKDAKLDALIIVHSETSWTKNHMDKHSGEHHPEELKIKIKSSTLLPLHHYHDRLEKMGIKEKPNVSLCYKSYETEIKIPILISVPEELKNFDTIDYELLGPMLKGYKDLTQMMIIRMTDDLKKTW